MTASSKQIITLVLCLRALPGVAIGQVRDGMLGNVWGAPVAAIAKPLELNSPRFEGNTILYSTDIHEIGDARLEFCQVEFVDGRFAGVIVSTRGSQNSERLLGLLKNSYGEGASDNPRSHTWMTAETRVSYDLDSFGDAYAYWYSRRLQK
jgi:hypothetical protein